MSVIRFKKSQRPLVEDFITRFACYREVDVTNPIEHLVAESLVKSGTARIIKKKNYGRIARIENLEYQPMGV